MWIAAAVLGLVTALGVRAFIWGYETINRLMVGAASTLPAPLAKRWWGHVPLPFWAKTGLAGLLIGVVSLWVPQVTGTGLHQMESIFSGQTFPITALLALALAKLLLTPTTLGSCPSSSPPPSAMASRAGSSPARPTPSSSSPWASACGRGRLRWGRRPGWSKGRVRLRCGVGALRKVRFA